MEKTTEAKLHRVNLRSPLPKIYYYQNKWLQVKEISVPNTNLQFNPYPNTQLDLWCNDNLSFQCTAPSTWLTNWCTDPSTWLTYQLEEDVGCKVVQFIQQWRLRNSLVTKPLAQRRSSFYKHTNLRKMLAAKLFSSSNNEDQEAPWIQNPWHKDAVASTRNMMN